jgi:uncharacterized protein with PIN domain
MRREDTPDRVCPYCQEALLERGERNAGQDVPPVPNHVQLLRCANGHEFVWREGLPQLLPRRG